MDKFRGTLLQPLHTFIREFPAGRHEGNHREERSQDHSETRPFTLQPIVGLSKQAFGAEALFGSGWEDVAAEDLNTTSRIMVDNWLLFGFDELSCGRPVFLKCSRSTLLDGFLTLLPCSAVFEIQESVEPDSEVLSACRSLKAAGYRLALDDFESPGNMEPFLPLADFIKVDYRHSGRRERASMLRRLRLTTAALIAEHIESEEDFQHAREEGYGLFQGLHLDERISYVKKSDSLDRVHCTRILNALQDSVQVRGDLAESISLQPGIECRLLRRANWVTPPNVVINSIQEALEVVERADIRMLVTLAMGAAPAHGGQPAFVSLKHFMASDAAPPVRWSDLGLRNPWWLDTEPGGLF